MWHIQWLPTTPSTQTALRNQWQASQVEGALATLDQTNGRGRKHNIWESPKNNLALSVNFKIKDSSQAYPLNMLASLILIHTLQKYAPHTAFKIKWPNDVWFENKKIAGIMSELLPDHHTVILGVGVNLNTEVTDFSESLQNQITTLKTILGYSVSAQNFCSDFLNDLFISLNQFNSSGLNFFLEEIHQKLLYKNQTVCLSDNQNQIVEGQLVGVAKDGSAQILNHDVIQNYIAGDLSLRGNL